MDTLTRRQHEIVDQAISLIADLGIEKLTYRNLSKRIGITEAAFYRHFPGKTDLLLAVLRYFENIRSELFAQISVKYPNRLDAIKAVITEHCRLFDTHRSCATLLFPEMVQQNRVELETQVLAMMRSGQERIGALVREGIDLRMIRGDLDPSQTAHLISGALRLLVTTWRLERYPEGLPDKAIELSRHVETLLRNPCANSDRQKE